MEQDQQLEAILDDALDDLEEHEREERIAEHVDLDLREGSAAADTAAAAAALGGAGARGGGPAAGPFSAAFGGGMPGDTGGEDMANAMRQAMMDPDMLRRALSVFGEEAKKNAEAGGEGDGVGSHGALAHMAMTASQEELANRMRAQQAAAAAASGAGQKKKKKKKKKDGEEGEEQEDDDEDDALPAPDLGTEAERLAGVDRVLAGTMRELASAANDAEGLSTATVEGTGEAMMSEMIREFESLAHKDDYDAIVDGMMRQLLSKELMYEPMKHVCERFPEWLAERKAQLPTDEYERCGKQYQCFQRIVALYDTEPDNFPRLMELMFDAQQYGQPPAEIIKDLAPGLEFDDNGIPIMANMGPSVLPSVPPLAPGCPVS